MQLQIYLEPRTVSGCSFDVVNRGERSKGGGTAPRLWRRLSSPILSSLVKKESGPRRALARLHGRNSKRRGYQPRKKSPKSLVQCVSNSEAASGLLTGYQGTDALANLPGSPYQSHPHHRHPPKGWVLRAGAPALSGVFLSIFFLRRRRKNMAPGGR